tara:strand:- start:909 stop:1091 length:183 start_codon:yes stop_codon:yes gene_type:complete
VSKNITIKDKLTEKKLKLSFSEFYSLIIGCEIASEFYSENFEKNKFFQNLAKKLDNVSSK